MPLPRWSLGPFLALAVGAAASPAAGAGAPDLSRAREQLARERWAAADTLATAALAAIEPQPGPDSLLLADALDAFATAKWRTVGYTRGGGFDAAARALAIRMRHLPADEPRVADSHALFARFLQGTGRADSALAEMRRALDARTRRLAPDDTLLAKTWDQLALIQRDRADFRAALDAWNHAIDIRVRVHGREHPEVARLLAQTGVPWMQLGDLDRARQVLEESLELFARTAGPDAAGRWIPLNILSDVEFHNGNVARDLDLLREALRVVRLNYGDGSREAITLRMNLSIALGNLGDPEGAVALLTPLLPQVEAQYGPTGARTLRVRHELAVEKRAVGDTATARRLLQGIEVDLLRTKEKGANPLLSTVVAEEGELLYRQGRDAEAIALYDRARAIEQASPDPDPEKLADLGAERLRTLVAGGDTAAVARQLAGMLAFDAAHDLGPRSKSRMRFEEARAAQRLGRTSEAWSWALEAERLSREQVALNLQTLPDRHAVELARIEERYLELVLLLARGAGPERTAIAWDRLVRTRGLVRAELARRRLSPALASDTTLAGAHERWLRAQRAFARRLVAAAGDRDSAAHAVLARLRGAVEESENAWARLLHARGAEMPAADVGLADVRAHLGSGEVLVGFYRSCRESGRWMQLAGRDTSDFFAFVARAGGDVRLVELGTSRELEAVLDPWRERLAVSPGPRARGGDTAEEACRRFGAAVRRRLWEPIASHVAGAADVHLVADDPLLDLPWQALPAGPDRYLVETGPRIHVLNAERELAEAPLRPGSGSLLAVGAPDFDRGVSSPGPALTAANVRAAPDPCSGAAPRALAPLPGSGAEVEGVARLWREGGREVTTLGGDRATEAAFKENAPGRTVIHVATHGVVLADTCAAAVPGLRGVGGVVLLADASGRPHAPEAAIPARPARRRSPWLSRRVWLALAGANAAAADTVDENEGFLTAEEVLTLDLGGTDWVVLSACRSGLAEAWSRDGTLGMRRAFDLAGARTVIASQWSVEDEATREWMSSLYAARATGATSAAAAIESASRTVLAARRRTGRSTHPFYWAAFSASGE